MTHPPEYPLHSMQSLIAIAEQRGHDIIDLGMGNPDLRPADAVIEAIREASRAPQASRYMDPHGSPELRAAICDWYEEQYGVQLDPRTEAIAICGVKEGIAHLTAAQLRPGQIAVCPDPAYPIHYYAPILAHAEVCTLPLDTDEMVFLGRLRALVSSVKPTPRLLILSFPHNPTGQVVSEDFFREVVELAFEYDFKIIHDFAYGELGFNHRRPPSILSVPKARNVAVEMVSLSKSHSLAGWRIGFACGNADMIAGLARTKSYLDYGIPWAVQAGALEALNGSSDHVQEINWAYRQRRDALIDALNAPGAGSWTVPKPPATMFAWGSIPDSFRFLTSTNFAWALAAETGVIVAPGRCFGCNGEGHVRFSLIQDVERLGEAARRIRGYLAEAETEPEWDSRQLALSAVGN